MKVLIITSIIAKGVRCFLIHGLFYLFVLRIGSKGHLKGAENDLR